MDYYKRLNIAITVSKKDGEILYQNDSSIEVNGDARGRDLMKCHAKTIVGGLVEFSIVLPDEMPHYDRG